MTRNEHVEHEHRGVPVSLGVALPQEKQVHLLNRIEKAYPKREDLSEQSLDPNSSHAKILELVGDAKRVLDVGCASGYLARLLSGRGCAVVGIDVSEEAVREAEAHCSRALVADLDTQRLDALLPGERFDAVIFGDVLEHVRDPWRVLDEARRVLAEGGFVVASIPNIAHGAIRLALVKGRFAYSEFGILDETHLRFFTRRSLDELFVRTGYTVERLERTVLPLFEPSDLVPTVAATDFEASTVRRMREDPDCETLQFVVKAIPLDDDTKLERLTKEYVKANSELDGVHEVRLRLEEELAYTRRTLQTTHEEMIRAQSAFEEVNRRLQTAEHLLTEQRAFISALSEAVQRREPPEEPAGPLREQLSQQQSAFEEVNRRLQTAEHLLTEQRAFISALSEAVQRREPPEEPAGPLREQLFQQTEVIADLERLKTRNANELNRLRRELAAAKEQLQNIERLREAYTCAFGQVATLSAERQALEQHCRQLTDEVRDYRERATVAERTLHEYLFEFVSSEDAPTLANARTRAAELRARFPAVLAELNATSERLSAPRPSTQNEHGLMDAVWAWLRRLAERW